MAPVAWKLAGASVAGFAHQADGLPCQDAHAMAALPGGYLLAVVSDGAGSASRSVEGSHLLCQAVIDHLGSRLGDVGSTDGQFIEAAVRQWIEEAIVLARSQFETLAKRSGHSIFDFHATLVGAVAGPVGGVFFHVGDGAACATRSKGFSTTVVSHPENGEYANETYFVTLDEWREHLRTLAFGPEYDLIAVMSDGVTPFALTRGMSGPAPAVFEPLSRFLTTHSRDEGERALAALLERDALRRVTGDDKTLLWALRVGADGSLLHR